MKTSRLALLTYARSNCGKVHPSCVCTDPGSFRCSVPGILAGLPQENGQRYIERCDTCETFACDEVAGLVYALVNGGSCRYDRVLGVVWNPK